MPLSPSSHDLYTQERHDWYYGLPSRPALLARSPNGIPFGPSSIDCGFPADKVLYPIDPEHPICAAWRADLDEEVIAALRELLPAAWSVIPLRIGEIAKEAHTVLFIAAQENSATADQGQAAVDRLVDLLSHKGLEQVDVEIHESSHIELGRLHDYTSDELWFRASYRSKEAEVMRRFSTALGAEISLLSDRMRCGTSGVWIVCGAPEARRRYLLTCGHLIKADENEGAAPTPIEPVRRRTGEPVVQFLGVQYEDCLERYRNDYNYELQGMCGVEESFWRARSCKEPAPTREAAYKARADALKAEGALSDFERRFGEPSQHVIGWIDASNTERYVPFEGAEWTCDWSLIRPDPEKFAGLSVNGMSLTKELVHILPAKRADLGWTTPPSASEQLGPERRYSLDGFCLTGDIFDVPAARLEARMLYKLGAASGPKGCVNSVLEARVRVGKDTTDPWTSQIAVFGDPGWGPRSDLRHYSRPGDSGAVVVDAAGDVLGLATAGQARTHPDPKRQLKALTFVTPIGAIFKDLERAGFENPVIAPAGLF